MATETVDSTSSHQVMSWFNRPAIPGYTGGLGIGAEALTPQARGLLASAEPIMSDQSSVAQTTFTAVTWDSRQADNQDDMLGVYHGVVHSFTSYLIFSQR